MNHFSKFFILISLLFCSNTVLFGGANVNANFSANKTTVIVGETVTFTDMSTDAACNPLSSWSWDFGVDASPGTAGTQGPHGVTYGSIGTKTVELIADDGAGMCGPDTENKVGFITVIAAMVPTLSEWGLILLALLLMNLGSVVIAQEKFTLATARNYSFPFTRLQLPFSSTHFNKAILLTAILVFVGFVGSIVWTGTIAASDLIGSFV
ncbi:MAG: IPTL-CTERM sorting domain-containing protein, partial [Chitinophagales bacterium]